MATKYQLWNTSVELHLEKSSFPTVEEIEEMDEIDLIMDTSRTLRTERSYTTESGYLSVKQREFASFSMVFCPMVV